MLTGSSSSSSFADEMCVESRRAAAAAGRRGGGKRQQQAAGHGKAVAKQPQRGLGVAQLEKIRLHNQMMAAYRSAAGGAGQQDYYAAARTPFGGAAPATPAVASPPGASSFLQPPYRLMSGGCSLEDKTTEWGIVDAHRYDGGSPPPPSLLAHDLRDSSGQRLGQLDRQRQAMPQQHQDCWIRSASDDGSSAEDLDLELRL
ncbi:hypothetical protein BS78_03G018800 [Paspalum vaginatum]|nr:hypothetical protein BS78_03G018800 [Paspalum vaginatum]